MLRKLSLRGSKGFTSGLQVANLHLRGIAKGRDPSCPILLLPALLLLLSPQRKRICQFPRRTLLETVWKLRTGSVSWSQEPARGGEMAQFSALRATEKSAIRPV